MTIFVVEDQKIILQGIIKMFSRFCSDEIHAFQEPMQALGAMATLRPDVVFTDIVMEGCDGLTLIRKASQILPDCHFVIISGFADFEFARQAIALGVDSYLLKPIERSALEEVYHKIADARGKAPQAQEGERHLRISEEAMQYISLHSDGALSVPSIAAQIHVSPNYLSNVFKKETGISVIEAIRIEQMKTAARLLRQTNMYLYEIAEQMGYKDVKYFSALFREYHQITPKNYKKQMEQERENEHDVEP